MFFQPAASKILGPVCATQTQLKLVDGNSLCLPPHVLQVDGCLQLPAFGIPGNNLAIRCGEHAEPGMELVEKNCTAGGVQQPCRVWVARGQAGGLQEARVDRHARRQEQAMQLR